MCYNFTIELKGELIMDEKGETKAWNISTVDMLAALQKKKYC